MKQNQINILIPSGGNSNVLLYHLYNNKKTRFNITICDRVNSPIIKFIADNFFQSPAIDSKKYFSFIENICIENQIDIIIPTISADVLFFSKYYDKFDRLGSLPMVSSFKACSDSIDKTRCFDYLRNKEINVPDYFEVHTPEEFEKLPVISVIRIVLSV